MGVISAWLDSSQGFLHCKSKRIIWDSQCSHTASSSQASTMQSLFATDINLRAHTTFKVFPYERLLTLLLQFMRSETLSSFLLSQDFFTS